MEPIVWVLIVVVILAIWTLFQTARIVPTQWAFVVQRLGKYKKTLEAGFHILIPFLDKVAYKHSLKYMRVIDPIKASYGIRDYRFAITQLAQTTMRSEIGKMDLDVTFESRDNINSSIVAAVDEASDPWGIKVTRYEIKNIDPPPSIRDAMEKQMRAEREKRAMIAESEGERQANINRADGEREAVIARSEGEKLRKINEAEGKASEIEKIAKATAYGLKEIAQVISDAGGTEAVNLRIAEQYIQEFGKLAGSNNSMILPANLADVSSIIATATSVVKKIQNEGSKSG